MESYINNSSIEKKNDHLFNILTIIAFIPIAVFIIYGFCNNIFSSRDAFLKYINSIGVYGIAVFIIVQAVQVVIPILPGSIGCGVGVIAFGPILGFIYNYIGICAGSVIAFLIARRYGILIIKKRFKPKTINKYFGWLDRGKKFDFFFTLAILSPVAPDDFLCYLAGITKMTVKKFSLIILLCKPPAIILYSMGLAWICKILGF